MDKINKLLDRLENSIASISWKQMISELSEEEKEVIWKILYYEDIREKNKLINKISSKNKKIERIEKEIEWYYWDEEISDENWVRKFNLALELLTNIKQLNDIKKCFNEEKNKDNIQEDE